MANSGGVSKELSWLAGGMLVADLKAARLRSAAKAPHSHWPNSYRNKLHHDDYVGAKSFYTSRNW